MSILLLASVGRRGLGAPARSIGVSLSCHHERVGRFSAEPATSLVVAPEKN